MIDMKEYHVNRSVNSQPRAHRWPYRAGGRVCVLLIVLTAVVVLLRSGHEPAAAVAAVLAAGLAAGTVAVRLLGPVPRSGT